MNPLIPIAPLAAGFLSEPDVEVEAVKKLRAPSTGYVVKQRKCGLELIDKAWPSKSSDGNRGKPDLLLLLPGSSKPACVWENKGRNEKASAALDEAKFYIEGLHKALKVEPSLPRVAAGFNGAELLISFLSNDGTWVPIRLDGNAIQNSFPIAELIRNGISSVGALNVPSDVTAQDLREVLWKLKILYRNTPGLAEGRGPIDFTIALLTLRLLVELNTDWGTWAEQPSLQRGVASTETRIFERFKVLAERVFSESQLESRYGQIFRFRFKEGTNEAAFDFVKTLNSISRAGTFYEQTFEAIDGLPPLIHADFDIFGEVYQFIGDAATKKVLGQFFTPRHIIKGTLPVLFHRAGYTSFDAVKRKKFGDLACGTGGFLTEALRLVRKAFSPSESNLKRFASDAFFGFDVVPSNASRARVNMYFAGDGFSEISGDVDSLSPKLEEFLKQGALDAELMNPPYGARLEERFLARALSMLKPGTGWLLIVLPTGVLENPRSAPARFALLKQARVTDVIALPKHAFAPYTQQRTGIVIAQRRAHPIAAADGDWAALLDAVGDEQVNLYIIDNDGYANSDKRYRTDRKRSSGEWFHDELSAWTAKGGAARDSTLIRALIHGVKPPDWFDEFGNSLGPKFLKARASDLLINGAVVLLPDVLLRRPSLTMPLDAFLKEVAQLVAFREGKGVSPDGGFMAAIDRLLGLPLTPPAKTQVDSLRIDKLFEIHKGDTGLTEESIYKHFDPTGIPVYGGGAEPPSYKIKSDAATKHGADVSVHEGPAIVVSMDGSSGAMTVIEAGRFCSNHHGCVLKPLDPSIDLHWVVQQAEAGLKRLASNQGGSSTLTRPSLEAFKLDVWLPKSMCKTAGNGRRQLIGLRDEFG